MGKEGRFKVADTSLKSTFFGESLTFFIFGTLFKSVLLGY